MDTPPLESQSAYGIAQSVNEKIFSGKRIICEIVKSGQSGMRNFRGEQFSGQD
jgi:hypothetical protein